MNLQLFQISFARPIAFEFLIQAHVLDGSSPFRFLISLSNITFMSQVPIIFSHLIVIRLTQFTSPELIRLYIQIKMFIAMNVLLLPVIKYFLK